jgi:uncharacterized protein YbdZ (MbtH family)
VSNPFDRDDLEYFALVNHERQYSLWPKFAAIPAGWTKAMGPASKADCLAYIEEVWTDMRPQSLVEAMANDVTH